MDQEDSAELQARDQELKKYGDDEVSVLFSAEKSIQTNLLVFRHRSIGGEQICF